MKLGSRLVICAIAMGTFTLSAYANGTRQKTISRDRIQQDVEQKSRLNSSRNLASFTSEERMELAQMLFAVAQDQDRYQQKLDFEDKLVEALSNCADNIPHEATQPGGKQWSMVRRQMRQNESLAGCNQYLANAGWDGTHKRDNNAYDEQTAAKLRAEGEDIKSAVRGALGSNQQASPDRQPSSNDGPERDRSTEVGEEQ